MGPARVDLGQIAAGDQDLLGVTAFDQNAAAGVGDEASAPEFEPPGRVTLVAYAVDRTHVDSVRDGVAPLDCFPGRLLLRPMLGFLSRQPPDRSGIKQDLRA